MKALKLSALVLAVVSSSAMANVVTDTADSVVGGAKTLFKTATNPAAVSLELGTQGYGANVAWGINDSTELQAGWAGMNGSISTDIGGDDSIINWKKVLGDEHKDFEGKLKFKGKTSNPYLGVQMRPMNNWLTIGAGVIVPKHEFDVSISSTKELKHELQNGTTVTLTGDSSIKVTAENHNKLAPYATLGFRPNINNRFGLFAEVGAAYVGKYDTTVEVTTSNSALANDAKQIKEDIEKELNDTKIPVYPIVKAGITYRF